MRVCHFTSVHETTDDRIFLKECQSLQKAGYEVYIVGKGESKKLSGIQIVGCGEAKGRIDRFLCFSRKVYKKAKELDCDIYHFHDPELLGYGLKLKRKGKKVIFDSHEDVPAQILDKKWLPRIFRKAISSIYQKYESYIVGKIDSVIVPTKYIANKFRNHTKKVEIISNYPKLDDILFNEKPLRERNSIACYAGGISEQRGEKIMCMAMQKIKGELIIAGNHKQQVFENGGIVRYIGQVNRTEINKLYAKSVVGLVILQPCANYIHSQPIKMYEYMAAGLPVVYSSFPEWKEEMDRLGVGISVDPFNIEEVSKAVEYLFENREVAQEMGLRGRKAVEKFFSWDTESVKLCKLYATI